MASGAPTTYLAKDGRCTNLRLHANRPPPWRTTSHFLLHHGRIEGRETRPPRGRRRRRVSRRRTRMGTPAASLYQQWPRLSGLRAERVGCEVPDRSDTTPGAGRPRAGCAAYIAAFLILLAIRGTEMNEGWSK